MPSICQTRSLSARASMAATSMTHKRFCSLSNFSLPLLIALRRQSVLHSIFFLRSSRGSILLSPLPFPLLSICLPTLDLFPRPVSCTGFMVLHVTPFYTSPIYKIHSVNVYNIIYVRVDTSTCIFLLLYVAPVGGG